MRIVTGNYPYQTDTWDGYGPDMKNFHIHKAYTEKESLISALNFMGKETNSVRAEEYFKMDNKWEERPTFCEYSYLRRITANEVKKVPGSFNVDYSAHTVNDVYKGYSITAEYFKSATDMYELKYVKKLTFEDKSDDHAMISLMELEGNVGGSVKTVEIRLYFTNQETEGTYLCVKRSEDSTWSRARWYSYNATVMKLYIYKVGYIDNKCKDKDGSFEELSIPNASIYFFHIDNNDKNGGHKTFFLNFKLKELPPYQDMELEDLKHTSSERKIFQPLYLTRDYKICMGYLKNQFHDSYNFKHNILYYNAK